MMRFLAEALERQVLLADAGMEERLRSVPVDLARDLFGAEGCLAILSLTRAQIVRAHHEEQLLAGADLVRTNTAQASPLELRRYGLEQDAFAVNFAAAQLASAAVDAVPGDGRRRFVLGILRDLGWGARSRDIEDASALQTAALLAGGVDGVAIEVAVDTCRGPAFLRGAQRAKAEARSAAGIFLFQPRAEASEMLLRLVDGVIRYREVASEDTAGLRNALREANLIGGRQASDTAALDERLQREAEESARPGTAATQRPYDPALLPVLRRASLPLRRPSSPTGTVLHYASRFEQRR